MINDSNVKWTRSLNFTENVQLILSLCGIGDGFGEKIHRENIYRKRASIIEPSFAHEKISHVQRSRKYSDFSMYGIEEKFSSIFDESKKL